MIEFLQANWLTLAFFAGLAALFLLLRNRATDVEGGLDALIGGGQPLILEVYSNT